MGFSAKDKIVLTGAPFGYIHVVDDSVAGNPSIGGAMTFSNLQSVTYKLPKVESESESTENIDITRSDGAVIRFPKLAPTINGTDGTIASKEATGTATGKGEVTMVINEAPDEISGWTAFMKKLGEISEAGKLLYIVVPTGMTYSQRNTISANKKVDGWIHMLGRINNDIENQLGNSNATVSLTFVTHSTILKLDTDITSVVFPEITFYLGGTTKDVAGIKASPLTSDGTDVSDLKAGKLIIKPTA